MSENQVADPKLSQADVLQAAFARAGNAGDTGGSLDGRHLLKMDKNSGQWSFGADSDRIGEGAVAIVSPLSFKHGLVAWHGGKIEGQVMVPFTQPVPLAQDQAPVQAKGGWQDNLQVDLTLLGESGQEDIDLRYSQSSYGGKEAIRKLMIAIADKMNDSTVFVGPVVKFSSSEYVSKEWGPQTKPELVIVDWSDQDGNLESKQKLVEAPAEEKAPAVEEKAEAPTRKRRGAAAK